jgi:hypothetical protein
MISSAGEPRRVGLWPGEEEEELEASGKSLGIVVCAEAEASEQRNRNAGTMKRLFNMADERG